MRKLVISVALMVVCIVSFNAQAATLDFSAVQGGQGSTLTLSNATINLISGSYILVGPSAAGQSDGFCFVGSGCEADGEIIFNNSVKDLFFDVDGAQAGDSVLISAYDDTNSLLGSILATANGRLDFSAFGAIKRLFFDDSSTAAGVGYSTFEFENVSAVPVPAAVWLFGSALLGLMGVSRKKATSV